MAAITTEQQTAFAEIAEHLGHSLDIVAREGIQELESVVENIEQLRDLLTPHSPEACAVRARAITQVDGLDTLKTAAERYLFGDGALSDEQREKIAERFPMQISTTSVEDKVLEENEVWDLGTSRTPVVINLGTLTMKRGSKIVIHNTILQFHCQHLIRES